MLAVLCQNTQLQIINTIVTLVVTTIQSVNVLNKSSGHVSNIKEIYQLPGHACMHIPYGSAFEVWLQWEINTLSYFPLKPYFKDNHSGINLILHWVCIDPYHVWYNYAPTPVSKFNTIKLTKMRSIPQRKQHFPVSTTHKSQHYCIGIVQYIWAHYNWWTVRLIIFRSWIWTLMWWFTRVIYNESPGGWSACMIKLKSSYVRVWPDWVHMIIMLHAARSCNWWVY